MPASADTAYSGAMLTRLLIASLTVLLALAPSCSATAQGLPTVPRALVGQAGVLCVKLRGDKVADAFVVVSTGRAEADRELVAWVRDMDWSAPDSLSAPRDRWFPMPVAFGEGEPPAPPAQCGPVTPASGTWS